MDAPVNDKGLFAMLRSDKVCKVVYSVYHGVSGILPPLKGVHPALSQKKSFSREKILYDIQVCVVEMSQVYQKPVLFDQKRFFHYFRAPKPPQANPKIPIP